MLNHDAHAARVQATAALPDDGLPHFRVSWDALAGFAPAIESTYRPQPFMVETPADVVCVLGHPILSDRVDRRAAAAGFLRTEDRLAFVRELNGEFLLIHLDKGRRALTVVNDRFASIPFYYAFRQGQLVGSVFYADLWRVLRATGTVTIRQEAVFEFVALQRVLGSKTYDTISTFLPAASMLSIDAGGERRSRYWTPDFTKNQSLSAAAWSDELGARVRQSIRRKTSDGVRPGLFLSGGMDTRLVLAATPTPLTCFTVGFQETNEVRVAREAAKLANCPHLYLRLPSDYFSRYLDSLIPLSGGMYVYDHALFLGQHDAVAPHADVVFHGHGFDYLFQGMYLPTRRLRILSRDTFLRWPRALDGDVAAEYLASINFRLKTVDLMRYVRPECRETMRASLWESVNAVIAEARQFGWTRGDEWEYLIIHALSRHYSNGNVTSMITAAEQRTLSFDNDVFALYLSMPARHRFAARAMRGALRQLHPQLARLEAANTGLRIDASPWQQQAGHVWRHVKRVFTGNPAYRHPSAEDRTWPYRDVFIRNEPRLVAAAREAAHSTVLADTLPFLDMKLVAADVDRWLNEPAGGGDLIATLITLDRFFKLT